jgi:hypothetical protein
MVRSYREQIGLEYFFYGSGSPDLAPVEDVWCAEKQKIKDFDYFDDDSPIAAIKQAWSDIPPSTIDRANAVTARARRQCH